MARSLSIQFDPNQDYQIEAIESVVRLFEGLPNRAVEFNMSGEIVPNPTYEDVLGESGLYDNLLAIQEQNCIDSSPSMFGLQYSDGMPLSGVSYESHRYPNFTIEMETGTGKTYVYLRTIYELRKRYGFSKFIVVVPSIAIFEGVIKNFEITRDHFRALYANETVNLTRYDGAQISRLRSFATSTFTEIMVITLDAFNKANNNIYKPSEKLPGERLPYQFIQEARPILILDEPQNMESDRAQDALRTLKPLFALRYSATHRTSPNLVYRLTPFDAYRRDLVKKIQVYGVTERDNFNRPFLALQSISKSPSITAKIKTYVAEGGRTREADITLKQGDDLFLKTKRPEHEGYVVAEINAGDGFVQFDNGIRLSGIDAIGPSRPEIFRAQIKQTIEQHIETQNRLHGQGIKILSLFFIDRVANYIEETGLIRRLFDEAFDRLKSRSPHFAGLKPEQVREAYFAKKKTKTGEEDVDTAIEDDKKTAADRAAEKAAFELIMRKKEQLLSFDEKVCFIFAHSALKEGWDNPNVFQICTLNQTTSEVKKRQEIGRGLRLCVNQNGERVFGDEVNLLTIVANESYSSYAAHLQQEYIADGDAAPPLPSDARKRWALRNDVIFEGNAEFRAFWENLCHRASYRVHIDTAELIARSIERLNNQAFPSPQQVIDKGDIVRTQYTIRLESASADHAKLTVEIIDTNDQSKTMTRYVRVNDNLARLLADDRLKPYTVREIALDGDNSAIIFDDRTLYKHTPLRFETETGERPRERIQLAPDAKYPVFNLLDRTVRETGLTRPTINHIFKGMHLDKKTMLLKNPEGFAGVFIAEIKNTLADHVAHTIEFVIDDVATPYDLDELFPSKKRFPQKELIEAGKAGLYDLVQSDSRVEETFVECLRSDKKVLFYFKFPPAFKLHFPKIIGNYNPDWGIARYDESGAIILHLVRETKGDADPKKLRFPSEGRKILCAKKYFTAMHIRYRHVAGDTPQWWLDEDETGVQADFDL